jgi:hypothetical protein
MTYANDCIQERKRGLKRIEDHSTQELNDAIEKARAKFGEDFWLLLHGIDAYMERRKRRDKRRVHQLLEHMRDDWQ